MSTPGMLALVLHAHLPFVRHPEEQNFLEERWLFEAITESYLPLLERFQRLANDRVPFRVTMSFSPTLLAMLADPLLQARYVRHVEQLIELSEKEIQRTRWHPLFQRLALFYHHRFSTARRLYLEVHHRDLIQPFRELSERGCLEAITTSATHGLLSLMGEPGPAARAQIHVGIQAFAEAFGRRPTGFWLPECGYAPGLDELLAAEGIRYTIIDAHGLLFGSPRPRYGIFAPAIAPGGIAAFGRDPQSAKEVWHEAVGYPLHPDYREFHRDIGHELDYDYVRPYLNGDGTRIQTGLKYYRVGGGSGEQPPYDPDRALEQAARHAEHFLRQRRQQIQSLRKVMDRPPLIVSPYDAELFGHWWFEGPDWLEFVIRQAQTGQQPVRLVAPPDYLEEFPSNQPLAPVMSTWGAGGYHEVWLNGANDWIYRHLQVMEDRMTDVARRHRRTDPLRRRAMNQMARELLLAQASDWAFILKAQTHAAYVYRRLNDHLARFSHLYDSVMDGRIDEPRLAAIEKRDALFPSLDYRIYAEPARRASAALH